MLKVVGAVMIFIACCGMGFGKSMEYRKRIRELLVLKKMLLMLRGEIKYARTPLSEAFSNIGNRQEHALGGFFVRVSKQMDHQQGETFLHIWESNLDNSLSKSALTKEDKKQLKRLGNQLGYLDKEMQISTIEFQVEQLETLIKKLEEEQGKRSRVCNCMGVFAGLMLNLILL